MRFRTLQDGPSLAGLRWLGRLVDRCGTTRSAPISGRHRARITDTSLRRRPFFWLGSDYGGTSLGLLHTSSSVREVRWISSSIWIDVRSHRGIQGGFPLAGMSQLDSTLAAPWASSCSAAQTWDWKHPWSRPVKRSLLVRQEALRCVSSRASFTASASASRAASSPHRMRASRRLRFSSTAADPPPTIQASSEAWMLSRTSS